MEPKKRNPKIIVMSGFVVGIIAFIIINVVKFEVFNMLYLLMLIFYFCRFLYLEKYEKE